MNNSELTTYNQKLTYFGYGKDLIEHYLSNNVISKNEIDYLNNLNKQKTENIDDVFNLVLKAHKLTPYKNSKQHIIYKNKKNKLIKEQKIIDHLIEILKIREIEKLIKLENNNIQNQLKIEIESPDLVFFDMEQAEKLLNINIIENEEEKMICYFSNEDYLDIDEAASNIKENLKNRFGLNVVNVNVVDNQFIIENKNINLNPKIDNQLLKRLQNIKNESILKIKR